MKSHSKNLFSLSLIALSSISGYAMAEEHDHRAHASHEHGAAKIDLVLDGNELAFDWMSPAANLLGFEHQAKTDAQKQTLASVKALLGKPEHILALPSAAGCKVTAHSIDSELFASSDVKTSKQQETHEHDEHGHEDNEHKHDDEHKHDAHDDHDDHEHHEDAHADVIVSYHFECAQPQAITTLTFTLFQHFSLTEKVQVQGIINEQQLAETLTPQHHSLTW